MQSTDQAAHSSEVDDPTALDAALSPVRRVLAYASRRGPESVRFLEMTASRWVALAKASPAPPAALHMLDAMLRALDGFDSLGADDQELRLADLHAHLAALDRLLGLPLPVGGLPAPAEPVAEPATPRERSSRRKKSSRRGRRSTAKKSSKSKSTTPREPEAPPADTPSVRWSDENFGGGEIADLDIDDGVVARLTELGLTRTGQLLGLQPCGVEIVQPILGAGRVKEPGRRAVGGRVRRRWSVLRPDGGRESYVVLHGAGPTTVRWTGGLPDWLLERLTVGQRAILVGEVQPVEGGGFLLCDPELAHDDGKHAARLAQYGLPEVADADLRALIHQCLEEVERLVEPLPSSITSQRRLISLAEALQLAHLKGDRSRAGSERLAYDESLLVHLGLLWSRYQGQKERGLSHSLLHRLVGDATQRFDVELSDEQQVAFEDIKRDLRDSTPMRRVLTGEVGAGKGLVALLTSLIVADNKHQVVVIAPDRATAEQRYAFTEPVLRELGLVARLYVEPPSNSQRDAIKRGEVHILFGTSDLLDPKIEYRRLGLVVAGERDTFGALPAQVESLRSPSPDLLVITSTPVPSPVLLSAYPAFDFTVLRSFPGRPVPCTVCSAAERESAYERAGATVRDGGQVIIVFPMRRGTDAIDAPEALRIVATLQSRIFPEHRVRLFHGGMSREERYQTWAAFRDRSIDVLLTTTHFEAGPAVRGARLVIVEQADRMSLSRLHRVRGHIAVAEGEPECILITGEQPDESGMERVERFAQSTTGFQVAVQELEQRGLRDMVAGEVGPEPCFSWLDPLGDVDSMLLARSDARAVLQQDPGLRRGLAVELARYLRSRWSDLLPTPCPVQVPTGGGRRRRRRKRR